MNKKIILTLVAATVVVGSVVAMSAFEAHVINVTAHIENALSVSPEHIGFGTVFPQEYLEEEIIVSLSQSFLSEDRVDDVQYVIKQKPKPTQRGIDQFTSHYLAHEYCLNTEPAEDLNYYLYCYLSLCPYLSKTDGDPDDINDTSHPSYYVDPDGVPGNDDDYCVQPQGDANGRLAKSQNDESDVWIIDLKVPPVDGYVGQDWPAGCPVVAENDIDYGCDLWIEIVDISRIPEIPGGSEVLSLENKDDEYWLVENDDMYGTLIFDPESPTFDWTLTVNGMQGNTDYKLVYAPDPWPQSLPGSQNLLIHAFTTDGDGYYSNSGSTELGMDLPHTDDDNHPDGAKIWVVLAGHHDNTQMTGWEHTKYLFEYNLIDYNDTDI